MAYLLHDSSRVISLAMRLEGSAQRESAPSCMTGDVIYEGQCDWVHVLTLFTLVHSSSGGTTNSTCNNGSYTIRNIKCAEVPYQRYLKRHSYLLSFVKRPSSNNWTWLTITVITTTCPCHHLQKQMKLLLSASCSSYTGHCYFTCSIWYVCLIEFHNDKSNCLLAIQ